MAVPYVIKELPVEYAGTAPYPSILTHMTKKKSYSATSHHTRVV
jgi:hypothetical protein